jgi:hypothetical protein
MTLERQKLFLTLHFSAFPIGNPKQHHDYPPIFPKPKKEVLLKVEIHLIVQ